MPQLRYFGTEAEFGQTLAQAGIQAQRTPLAKFVQFKTLDGAIINWFKGSRKGTVHVDGDGIAAQAVMERLIEQLAMRDNVMPGRPFEMALEHLEYFGFVRGHCEGAVANLASDVFPVGVRIEQYPEGIIRISSRLKARPDKGEELKDAVCKTLSKLQDVEVTLADGPAAIFTGCYVGGYNRLRFGGFVVRWWRSVLKATSWLKAHDFLEPEGTAPNQQN